MQAKTTPVERNILTEFLETLSPEQLIQFEESMKKHENIQELLRAIAIHKNSTGSNKNQEAVIIPMSLPEVDSNHLEEEQKMKMLTYVAIILLVTSCMAGFFGYATWRNLEAQSQLHGQQGPAAPNHTILVKQ
ncbi:hypothetical protein COR50_13775 [Chitinophaga caeni]|uniref:Uncharacterized protein n=1 Tax=Chitinophaga caeni TaxID=2029983 RepID=A0A291QW34_9BACT|nr:hypothetical protein [Chitinophaga caeni]ATL48145.1 hypothetical protein COR50_13775 [Chitinophaga caeni]